MLKCINPSIFLPVFILVFSLTVLNTQADVYESVRDPKANAFGNRVCTNEECTIVAANLLNYGNKKIEPCTNFAQFTCDRYQLFQKDTPFHETEYVTNKILKLLLETPTSPEDKPYHTLTKEFYRKCTLEKTPRPPDYAVMLDEIGGWPLLKPQTWVAFDGTFEEYIADIHKKSNTPVLFNAQVIKNYLYGNTNDYMLYLAPATAIQMPSSMLLAWATALGADYTFAVAEIDEMSSNIDKKRQKLLDDRKPRSNKVGPFDSMKQVLPNFNLEKYVLHLFDGIAEINSKTIIFIENIEYFQDIHTLLTDKRIFANYAGSAFLSHFVYSFTDCLYTTRELFEYPLSQLYVKNHFDHAAVVPKVAEMFKLIKEELHEIIEKADWLDDTTRSFALKKLVHLKADIGHPENLFNDTFVSDMYNIPPSEPSETYLTLLPRVRHRLHVVQLSRISRKVDRTTWVKQKHISVLTANAFHSTIFNTVYICAGILTLPHFSPNLPDYINYAITGHTVAHEIMHGFDNNGRLYDENGDYRDWWKAETADVYKAKSECLVKQYDKENYDGQLSLGENIADNEGMTLAFKAYKKLMASRGGFTEPALPGFEEFTPEEMFFMAYANTCCNAGPTNPNERHPPGETRLKVVSQNMKEFSETFACPKEAPMNPDERCSIW